MAAGNDLASSSLDLGWLYPYLCSSLSSRQKHMLI